MTSPRKRLLFLESLQIVAGGQQCLLDLVKSLKDRYEIVVVLPGDGPLAKELAGLGIACRFIPVGSYSLLKKNWFDVMRYAIRFPWLTMAVWRIILQERIDLVYANSARTFLWGTLAALLARRLILWHLYSALVDSKVIVLLNLWGRLPTVRRILSVCESTSAPFPALHAKTTISYVGVDTETFQPRDELGREFRHELGVPDSAKLVGVIGNLIPLKGQDVLLRAAVLVNERLPDIRFVVIGQARAKDAESQEFEAQLRRSARDLGLAAQVIFTGYYPDILKATNGLDILVSSSRIEAMPLVLLQAGACGKPVVASAVGGVPEMIQSGANGWLYPAENFTELARLLVDALSDQKRLAQIGATARQMTMDKFSVDRFVARVEAQIDRALAH